METKEKQEERNCSYSVLPTHSMLCLIDTAAYPLQVLPLLWLKKDIAFCLAGLGLVTYCYMLCLYGTFTIFCCSLLEFYSLLTCFLWRQRLLISLVQSVSFSAFHSWHACQVLSCLQLKPMEIVLGVCILFILGLATQFYCVLDKACVPTIGCIYSKIIALFAASNSCPYVDFLSLDTLVQIFQRKLPIQ